MESASLEVPTQSADSKADQRGQELAVVPSLAHSVHPTPNTPCAPLMLLTLPSVVNESIMKDLPAQTPTVSLYLPSEGGAEVSQASQFLSAVAFCEAGAHILELEPSVSEPFCVKAHSLYSWGITSQRLGVGHSVGIMAVSNIMCQSETPVLPAGSSWSS